MRFPFRPILFGVLAGAFLFFFPFHFFFFPVLLVFLLIRVFFRPWRWRHARYRPWSRHPFAGPGSGYYPEYGGGDFEETLPIDGYAFVRPGTSRQKGQNIPIQ